MRTPTLDSLLPSSATLARGLQGRAVAPAYRASRDENHLHVTLDVAGVAPEDIEVHTQGRVCEIRARRAALPGEALTADAVGGELARTFIVGPDWDARRAEASLRHGQLHLTIPRAEGAQKRRVPIAVDGGTGAGGGTDDGLDGDTLVEVG